MQHVVVEVLESAETNPAPPNGSQEWEKRSLQVSKGCVSLENVLASAHHMLYFASFSLPIQDVVFEVLDRAKTNMAFTNWTQEWEKTFLRVSRGWVSSKVFLSYADHLLCLHSFSMINTKKEDWLFSSTAVWRMSGSCFLAQIATSRRELRLKHNRRTEQC